MIEMTPEYNTVLFSDVWETESDFSRDLSSSVFNVISDKSKSILYYLLVARYGNNPIANRSIEQWKLKIFSIIFQYGPTWERKLEIQERLRNLSEDELLKGSKAVLNHAMNPGTLPSTSALEELNYINDQNTSSHSKSKMDAYSQLWMLLKTDITEIFLSHFKKCFKVFVSPEMTLLYTEEEE